MNFNSHSKYEGMHSFLSASNHAWVNYDEDKLIRVYSNRLAAARGTELHDFACRAIKLGIKLPENGQTLNMYVNDAIGFNMQPEQVLFYSPNAFGTADAISYRNKKLRIHDLKTGVSEVSMVQLEIYAAFFCLEYDVKPNDIQMELRIYQSGKVLIEEAEPDDIYHLMDKIMVFDRCIEDLKSEGEW
jgi:hypothetical protein